MVAFSGKLGGILVAIQNPKSRFNFQKPVHDTVAPNGGNMPRHCLTLDLQDDPAKIAEYKRHHEKIWPEIRDSLFAAGVTHMEIYLHDTRMFMIMDVSPDFSFEKKAAMDAANPKVLEWEALMGNFQAVPEGADPVRRWAAMEKVFDLALQ
jgi:L-rhamnose mutarotase